MRQKLSKRTSKFSFGALIFSLFLLASGNASALVTADVVSSYGACFWSDNGDGTSTATVSMHFNTAKGNSGRFTFISRGLLIYTYDANGNLQPNAAATMSIKLNGVDPGRGIWVGRDYVMHYSTLSPWTNPDPLDANFELRINNAVIANWQGVAVRAGNYTSGSDVGEVLGAVYLTRHSNGRCHILDPIVPPPKPLPKISVNMAVPDWSLGELPRGESEKTLSGAAQQLCLTYSSDGNDTAQRFVIDATSQNGTSGGKFLLKKVDNSNQSVPYSVKLDSGIETFDIPNKVSGSINLNKGNRTCFVPTFKTSVGASIDTGNYSDVLSFTIVTKS
ncbi:hypothetical protein [Burkholderia cenocepacia]|uniref:hypothetical protein n=1 Tax=Burkholderia cenocepacia TaxID=95486 RepID=UPI0022375F9E|nr:hypothetical protein [Burkholderia cenocepacia]MCW5140965.1 hypothetical protein [Burkholderia cenocepacia]MEB2601426.1 hypothetical protein [Burkholderia cenocepacia]